MRTFLIAILLLQSAAIAQTVDGYLSIAFGHHKNGQLDSAEIYYGKSIRLKDTSAIARFNRANIYMSRKDYGKAMEDVNRTLELKPNYDQGLYLRANIHALNDDAQKALEDLEKLAKSNPGFGGLYSLRGQVHYRLGQTGKACADFLTGKQKNEQDANELYNEYCLGLGTDGNPIPESLDYNFDDGGKKWVEAFKSDTKDMLQLRYVREGNTMDVAQEAVTILVQKNTRGKIPLDTIMNFMSSQMIRDSKNAKATTLEREDNAEYPRIYFMVQNPDSTEKVVPQTQVYGVIKSHNAIYTMIWNIARPTVTKEEITKWVTMFKKQKIKFSEYTVKSSTPATETKGAQQKDKQKKKK